MSDLKPEYFEPIESDILNFLYAEFYKPILEITDQPKRLVNSTSAVISAIRSGKIKYDAGEFRGEFNIGISRELSAFATFDRRSRTWKGNPPPDVKAAAVVANSKREEIVGRLNSAIRDIEAKIDRQIESLGFGLDMPLFAMEEGVKKELEGVGIYSPLTDGEKKAMRDRYTFNQQRNVKNWAPEQIVRLRDMVQQYQTTGDNRSLREMIESEWGVSSNKARFLARQETSLFFSNLQLDRAGRAGVRRYRWSTSHDSRVRNDHKELQGQIISLDNPPIVDKRTGRRAHAGEDYNCFPGFVHVGAEKIEKAYRRPYFGKVLIIKTSNGLKLTVTPNHPILSNEGWIAADLIDVGSHVFTMPFRKIPNIFDVNINDRPPVFRKVFDFLRVSFSKKRSAGINEQFHGDGRNSYVDIISTDSKLLCPNNPIIEKHVKKFIFSLAKIHKAFLPIYGSLNQFRFWPFYTSNRIMGGASKVFNLLRGRSSHSGIHAFASIPDVHTLHFEKPIDGASLNSIDDGQGFTGLTVDVTKDKVVDIRRSWHLGHVYNLQTKSGWYIVSDNGNNANGLIVHNCRCAKIWILD